MKRGKAYCSILIFTLLIWCSVSNGFSDGGYFTTVESVAVSADQRTIIIKNGDETSMTFSTGYTGEGEDFGWIIPTPVVPLIEDVVETGESGEAAFDLLNMLTAPLVTTRTGGCFPAGTEVLTAQGPRAIETISPGIEIHSYDVSSGEWVLSSVQKQYTHRYRGDMITIHLCGKKIRATGNHPFYVVEGKQLEFRPLPHDVSKQEQRMFERGRWVEARDLAEGDVLFDKSSGGLPVIGLSVQNENAEVYNLEVEGFHNYALHRTGVLVHNKMGAPGESESVSPVTVYGTAILEHYEVSVLGARAGTALLDWLRQNEYHVDPAAREIIDVYIDQGWVFVAAKLNPGERRRYENEFLPPLTIRYNDDRLVFPLRISSVSTSRTIKITLYVIADTTVDSRNTPTGALRYDDILVKGADPEKYVETCIQKTAGEYGGRSLVVLWKGRFDRSAEHQNTIVQLMKTPFPEDRRVYLTRLEARMDPSSMTQDIELTRNPKPLSFWVRFYADEGYDLPVDTKELELIAACQVGERERVKELLDAGSDPNSMKEYDRTALIWAARSGHIDIVEILIEAGADVNGPKGCAETALIAAAGRGYTTVAKLLLEAGADVNGRNWQESTALIEALLYGDSQTFQLLLEAGSRVNLKNASGRTALMEAVKRGCTGWVWMLLRKKADVNAQDQSGRNALMEAVIPGRADLVKILLQTGADVNASNKDNETALTMAAGGGHTEIAKILIDAGANMNVFSTRCTTSEYITQGRYRMSALMWAIMQDHIDIVELLLQAGADVNARSKEGATALTIATEGGEIECVKMLIEAGADVEAKSEHRGTALIGAAYGGHTEIVKILLRAGADVNAKDRHGKTALMWAVQECHIGVVRVLLESGADVNVENRYYQTALEIAEMNNYTQIVEMLKEAGASE